MAKPYDTFSGNGMHMHFSILDQLGRNIFDNGGDEGTAQLRHAVAGCLRAMPGSTLLFAPHENSYDRLVPNAHAPTGIGWAYENRTSAIRIPASWSWMMIWVSKLKPSEFCSKGIRFSASTE